MHCVWPALVGGRYGGWRVAPAAAAAALQAAARRRRVPAASHAAGDVPPAPCRRTWVVYERRLAARHVLLSSHCGNPKCNNLHLGEDQQAPGLGTSAHLPPGTCCFTTSVLFPTFVLYLSRVSCTQEDGERLCVISISLASQYRVLVVELSRSQKRDSTHSGACMCSGPANREQHQAAVEGASGAATTTGGEGGGGPSRAPTFLAESCATSQLLPVSVSTAACEPTLCATVACRRGVGGWGPTDAGGGGGGGGGSSVWFSTALRQCA